MKNILILINLLLITTVYYTQNTEKAKLLDEKMDAEYNKKVIPDAEIGDLIALDEFGNYIIATGGKFEEIKGFTTNVPYVTPNKPVKNGASRVAFIGIVSLESGLVLVNDYLCPSTKIPGKVKRCTKNDNPYAIAQENASVDLQKIKVKILGRNL